MMNKFRERAKRAEIRALLARLNLDKINLREYLMTPKPKTGFRPLDDMAEIHHAQMISSIIRADISRMSKDLKTNSQEEV